MVIIHVKMWAHYCRRTVRSLLTRVGSGAETYPKVFMAIVAGPGARPAARATSPFGELETDEIVPIRMEGFESRRPGIAAEQFHADRH